MRLFNYSATNSSTCVSGWLGGKIINSGVNDHGVVHDISG
jgi:hypothetical protein